MSQLSEPAPAAGQSGRVVVISHSPFVYLWPVWAVGFLMAAITYFTGQQVAFVPSGTVARRDAVIRDFDGPRDVLIAPSGAPLPESPDQFGVKQPRFRMVMGNDLGIIWAMTLALSLLATHVQLKRMRSIILVAVVAVAALALAFFGLWDPIVRAIRILEIHITATGYLSISLLLLIIWALIYWVYDRQMAMTFTPGKLRVRTAIGAGETAYETNGLTVHVNRDAVIRHWLLGFGSGDLTVNTTGVNPTQLEWPNVFGVQRKVDQINAMVVRPEVVRAQ